MRQLAADSCGFLCSCLGDDPPLLRLAAADVLGPAPLNLAQRQSLAEKIAALKKKRGEYAAHLSPLEKSGESQISLTDPDSRAMAAHTKVGVGYNAQIAVDAKHKMIVEQAVTNDVLDMGLLQQTADPARQILGVETIDIVADKGYFRTEDIAACEKAGAARLVYPDGKQAGTLGGGCVDVPRLAVEILREVRAFRREVVPDAHEAPGDGC